MVVDGEAEKDSCSLEAEIRHESTENSETTENASKKTNEYARGVWDSKLEFILTVIGFSVGVGNLWRFPYLIMQNGGGAFLIPYFFFLIFCGVPLFYLELCLGQFSGISCLYVWKFCPLFKGIGYMMFTLSVIFCWYYIILMAWVLVYFVHSFLSELPWGKCDQDWNTDSCVISMANLSHVEGNVSSIGHTASKEFWHRYVLNKSSGLEEFGTVQWHLAVAITVAWIIVFLCLMKGIKSVGKVVYVTALLPFLLLTVFFIKGLTLPGAVDGIIFYISPNFSTLLNGKVWLQAAVQVFFSLGPAWGGLITMASYNKFDNNCLRDALIATTAEGFTSFYGGFVIFSVIGYMANEANMDIKDVATSGPGLALVIYPEAMTKLPVPQLWSVLFFLMVISLGIDSLFGVFETVSSGILDTFPALRKRKILITASLCAVFLILDLPYATNGGIYLYQLVDWYFATFAVLIISFLECVLVAWVYGADRFCDDIKLMVGRKPSIVIKICWCYITPTIVLVVFVVMCYQYEPPTYDGYKYPFLARVFGNVLAMIPILPLPLSMVYQIVNTPGNLWQRVCFLLRPSTDWDSHVARYRDEYSTIPRQSSPGHADVVKKRLSMSRV